MVFGRPWYKWGNCWSLSHCYLLSFNEGLTVDIICVHNHHVNRIDIGIISGVDKTHMGPAIITMDYCELLNTSSSIDASCQLQ